MKRLNAATTVLGLLAVFACFIATPSSGDSKESELEKSTDVLLKAGDYESALKLVEGFILEHPQRPIGYAMLAKVFAANGQTDEAFKAYYRFYKLGETFSEELLFELLLGALNDDSWEVQSHAVWVLKELGDDRAVPALINLLNHERSDAAEALGKLGDKSAVPHLIKILNDDDNWVR